MHTKQEQTERKTCKHLRRNNSRSSWNISYLSQRGKKRVLAAEVPTLTTFTPKVWLWRSYDASRDRYNAYILEIFWRSQNCFLSVRCILLFRSSSCGLCASVQEAYALCFSPFFSRNCHFERCDIFLYIFFIHIFCTYFLYIFYTDLKNTKYMTYFSLH